MDVKWIKLTTDMFDNRKIKHLRKLPQGDSIVLIWVMLLTMAGRCNAGGMIYLTENVPYTTKMLADELDFEESIVLLSIEALQRFNMVEYIDNNLCITNWEEYQNIEGLEKVREQNRIRKRNQRNRAKLSLPEGMSRDCHGTVTQCHATEEDIEIDKNKKKINYISIIDTYHETCVSFPKVTVLSDKRKQAIKARLATYSIEQFQEMFRKAEASDFLKGKNNRDWRANFDWLMKDSNFAKVLDGNYDNSTSYGNTEENNTGSFETDDFFEAALKRSYGK